MEERAFIAVFAALNLAGGLGGAMLSVRMLCHRGAEAKLRVRVFLVCLGVYFLECLAFPAGMATQVWSLALALVWGAALGCWLPRLGLAGRPWRMPVWVGIYTSAPTLTFCLAFPPFCARSGLDILSPPAGVQFGMPDFVPAPFQTILGFCFLLGFGTVFLKCGITTAVALSVLRRRNRGVARQAIHATRP